LISSPQEHVHREYDNFHLKRQLPYLIRGITKSRLSLRFSGILARVVFHANRKEGLLSHTTLSERLVEKGHSYFMYFMRVAFYSEGSNAKIDLCWYLNPEESAPDQTVS
jgi:hypothetical protein